MQQQIQEELTALKSIYGDDKIDVQDAVIIISPCKNQQIKLAAFVSEDYPDDPPIVTAEGLTDINTTQKQQLDEKLLQVSMELVGDPMLYTLACELQEWVEQQYTKKNQEIQDNIQDDQNQEQRVYHVPQTAESEIMSLVSKQSSQKGKKKPPMKPSWDVIKRIQWDDRLDSLNFTVGYEDRFLGIQERPFNDFTWKDLATVAITDLAIPQHRIQYFKYKGVVVWDKASQMDNVFGSRGGCTIYDVLDEVDEREQVEKDLDFESGEDEEHIFDDYTEETSSQMLNKDLVSAIENEVKPTFKKSSKRPNFFLCFKVDNEEIIEKVNQVQQYVLSQDKQISELFIPLEALHVTLCMLKLKNEDELNKALQVLKNSQSALASILTSNGAGNEFEFKGVSHFRDRVVYTQIKNPQEGLNQAVEFLRQKFKEADIPVPDDYREFTPHLTILKMSPSQAYKLNMSYIDRGLYFPYTHTNFGSQQIDQLHLCSVNSPFQKDGFYLTVQKLPLLVQNENQPQITKLLKEVYESWKEREDISLQEGFYEQAEQLLNGNTVDMLQLQKLVSKNSEGYLEGFLLIIRGIPGIGRSYAANYLYGKFDNKVAIIDESNLEEQNCNYSFFELLVDKIRSGAWFIIVEGVFQHKWEYNALLEFAAAINFGVQIVELSCSAGTTGLKFVTQRSKQRKEALISLADVEKILKNWEVDERARVVDAYIEKIAQANDPCTEIQNICEEFVEKVRSQRKAGSKNKEFIRYSAIFLPRKLLDAFGSTHEVVQADHITLQYQPSMDDILNLPLGTEVQVSVEGVAEDSQVQVVKVDIKKEKLTLYLDFEVPHITISHKQGAPPALSASLLSYQNGEKIKPVLPQQRITLDGIIGCLVDTQNSSPIQKCQAKVFDHQTLNCYFDEHTQKINQQKQFGEQQQLQDFEDEELCLGPQQPVSTLFVFDFDGTLYDHPENRKFKSQIEGTNITVADSFCLDQETALIPCSGIPLYRRYCGSAGSSTIILTGRWSSYEDDIKALLKRECLALPDKFLFKPHEFEQPTTEFKVNALKNLLQKDEIYANVRKIWILDDLPEVLAAYSRFSVTEFGKKYQFEIHDVAGQKEILEFPLPKEVGNTKRDYLFEYLGKFNYFPDTKFLAAAHNGLDFILHKWSDTMGYEQQKENLLLLQGGFSLGRKGDIDITLLAPYGVKQSDCAQRLYDELQSSGVQHVYLSMASALPRIRCKLQFLENYCVEYDIVFQRVNREVYKNGYSDLETLLKAIQEDDEASRRAAEGQQNFCEFQECISMIKSNQRNKIFAVVVEALIQIFRSFGMHGNAFHCPRTIHLTKLVSQTIFELNKKPKSFVINSSFELLIQVIIFVKTWQQNRWKKLFAKFVPENYISDIIKIFDDISKYDKISNAINLIQSGKNLNILQNLDQQELYNCFFKLLTKPKIQLNNFLQDGYKIIGIQVKEDDQINQQNNFDEVATWQLGVFIEARAQGYVRKILEAGIKLKPWNFEVIENQKQIIFQVLVILEKKSQEEIIQQFLGDLVKEIQSFIPVKVVIL